MKVPPHPCDVHRCSTGTSGTGSRRDGRFLEPLTSAAIARISDWLPKLTAPIRVGEHSQTAFSFGLMLDWSRATSEKKLESLLVGRARDFYLNDRACPLTYEPSGEDFLSACVAEADLMRRVLPQAEFTRYATRAPVGSHTPIWLRPSFVARLPRPDARSERFTQRSSRLAVVSAR
jgi:hypothetical protein